MAIKKYHDNDKIPGRKAGGLRPWQGHPVVRAFEDDPDLKAVSFDWVEHEYDSLASARAAVYGLLRRKFPPSEGYRVTTSSISDTELLITLHRPPTPKTRRK